MSGVIIFILLIVIGWMGAVIARKNRVIKSIDAERNELWIIRSRYHGAMADLLDERELSGRMLSALKKHNIDF